MLTLCWIVTNMQLLNDLCSITILVGEVYKPRRNKHTLLAVGSGPSWGTNTHVSIDSILAGTTILTWSGETLINIYKSKLRNVVVND